MVSNVQEFVYENFGGGLNFRDDEIKLPIGETPRAQNIEIVKATGLEKVAGFAENFSLPSDFDVQGIFNYTDNEGNYNYVAISYPEIILVNPTNGAYTIIHSDLVGTGEPEAFECDGRLFIVDGVNDPVVIDGTAVTTVSWPPSYTNDNDAVGNLENTSLATTSNPNANDIGQPAFGAYHASRVFLAGDPLAPRRIYASKVLAIDDFSDNDPLNFNIAFFVDVPTSRPITGLKVVSNRHLVVYCDREILLLSGEDPPGTAYPNPMSIRTLNSDVGALDHKLIAERGDNDHFFVSGNGRVFQLSLTQSFQEVKPLGLTEKIFPFLATRVNETFTRGRLVNHQLRGELQFWLPSADERRYPDQMLILNYGDRPESRVWSLNTDFKGLTLRGALRDRDTNEVILATPNEFLQTNKGNNFNGSRIKTIYQLSTLDFGVPYNNKEITKVVIYCRSKSGVDNITLNHVWENGSSGVVKFSIPALAASEFGSANFGINEFQSSAGEPFTQVELELTNPIGRLLKMTLQHESDSEDFTINSVGINFRTLGKP